MSYYKILSKQDYSSGPYAIVPIRLTDRYEIMKWRNDQLYHLRQNKLLTKEDQDYYFDNVISKLFQKEEPEQILFSYLKNNECIGYGGLVHINWIDMNAEISYIMNTDMEKEYFKEHWGVFLKLIEKVAFNDLKLHKISTFAFDLRPYLYSLFLESGLKEEARLKDHCYFEGKYIDVVIHSKINTLY